MDIQQLLQQIFGGQQPSPNLLVNPGQTQGRVPNLLAQPAPQPLPQDQFGSRFAAVPPMPAPVNVADMPVAEAPRVDPWEGLREVTRGPGVDPMVTGANPAMAPGTQGEIKRGPDDQMYQYAQTTGMAGANGDQGWIRTNQKPGFLSGLTDSGFKDRLGDMMLGWGMGGTAQESLAMGNKAIMAGNLTRKGREQENKTVEWLKGKGMSDEEARLTAANPSALNDVLKTFREGTQKKPIEINGKLVDPSTFEVIADYSDKTPKAPFSVSKDAAVYDPGSQTWITPPGSSETPKPDFKEIAGVRKEVQDLPSYKNLTQAAPIWGSMVKTAKNDSKASDLNLVYGLGKIMDPTSVVREGEMVMVKDTAGLNQQVLGWINAVNGGARLTPEVRQAIMQEAQTRIGSYKDMFDTDANEYRELAKRYSIDERDILPGMRNIPDLPEVTGGQSGAAGGIPEGATATNPQTNQKIIFRKGQWVPI